jgi:hypothetical protein
MIFAAAAIIAFNILLIYPFLLRTDGASGISTENWTALSTFSLNFWIVPAMSGLCESPISAISPMRERPTWAYDLLFFSFVSFISAVLFGLVIASYQNLDKFLSPSTAIFYALRIRYVRSRSV